MDYVARRLALSYLNFDERLELGLASIDDMPTEEQTSLLQETVQETVTATAEPEPVTQPEPVSPPVNQAPAMPSADAKATVGDATAPLCYNCGNQTQRAGSCYVCSSCGSTTGCS
jgi:ribonucleoside-diphosphate reductase alpha chain